MEIILKKELAEIDKATDYIQTLMDAADEERDQKRHADYGSLLLGPADDVD